MYRKELSVKIYNQHLCTLLSLASHHFYHFLAELCKILYVKNFLNIKKIKVKEFFRSILIRKRVNKIIEGKQYLMSTIFAFLKV